VEAAVSDQIYIIIEGATALVQDHIASEIYALLSSCGVDCESHPDDRPLPGQGNISEIEDHDEVMETLSKESRRFPVKVVRRAQLVRRKITDFVKRG
jgi:hypothetical protein